MPVKPINQTSVETREKDELEAVYKIANTIESAENIEYVLDKIIKIARPFLIFDVIVLYIETVEGTLEPQYARAVGRGRSLEADISWGENTASQAFHTEKTTIQIEDLSDVIPDRTAIRHYLGLPLVTSKKREGSLVLIRYGGPSFLPDHIRLAEYVRDNIAHLLSHKQLVKHIANLESKRRLADLQDEFIAMISHDLLTPLGSIKGFTTTLLREDAGWDAETSRKFLQIIDRETEYLKQLIDNLMESTRLQAGNLILNIFQKI